MATTGDHGLTPLVSVKEVFTKWDTDGDGTITSDEFAHAFTQIFPGTTKEQAAFFFRSIDLDKNGRIDFDEFSSFVDRQTCGPGEALGLKMREDSMRALFNAFDAGGKGKLSKSDVLNALRIWDSGAGVTAEDIDQMWPMFDTNGDGVIDFEEFTNLVYRQLRQDQASNMLYND